MTVRRTVGICRCKDEADIIRPVVEHMLGQVDLVVVADNLSSDGTRDVLADMGRTFPNDLIVVDDHEVGYYQSRAMTALAQYARQFGADWVVPFDADELWTCQWGRIGDVCQRSAQDYGILLAELVDHMVTGVDPTAGDVVDRLPWRRREPLELRKVACRATGDLVIEQGNHYARYGVPARPTDHPVFTVHHYPYRSPEQMIRKIRNGAAAYAETDLPPTTGAHWRQWGVWSDEQIRECFEVWYSRDDPLVERYVDGKTLDPLVCDPPIR